MVIGFARFRGDGEALKAGGVESESRRGKSGDRRAVGQGGRGEASSGAGAPSDPIKECSKKLCALFFFRRSQRCPRPVVCRW